VHVELFDEVGASWAIFCCGDCWVRTWASRFTPSTAFL
jgi:hypothetical protein